MADRLVETPGAAVVAGDMSVSGLLQKVTGPQQRLELARESGAKRVLVPSDNKRDLADVPGELLSSLNTLFYQDPLNAAIKPMGLE